MDRRTVLRLFPGAVALPVLTRWTSALAQGADAAPALRGDWDADRRVFVLDRSTEGQKRFFIIGDIVELSPENFPSLARGNGEIISGNFELFVDARHVILNMPLRMADGRVRIVAQHLEFGFDGLLGYSAAPAAGQSVSIFAETIDFTRARSIPFAFQTGKAGRTVAVKALSVTGFNPTTNPTEEFSAFLSKKTLGDAGAGPTDISYGDAAIGDYETALGAAKWPESTALKLQRFLSADPYGDANRRFIRDKAAELLQATRGVETAVVSTAVDRAIRAVDARTDLFGLLETDVPMSTLDGSLARMRQQIDGLFSSGVLTTWDRIALEASQPVGIDKDKMTEASGARNAAVENVSRLSLEGRDISSKLTSLEQRISQIDVVLKNREVYLAQVAEAEKNKGPNDKIESTFKVAAAIGSVAFPAAAPFLIVASGLVSVAAAMNKSEGDLVAKATTIAGIIESHSNLMKVSLQMRQDLNTVTGDFHLARKSVTDKKNLTREEQERVDKWKASTSSLGKQAETIAGYLKSSPPSAELADPTAMVNQDAEIQDSLRKRNALVKDQSDLLNRQLVVTQDLQSQVAQVLELEAVLAELQQLVVVNDEDRARYRVLADWTKRALLEGVAREAILLQRSLKYAGAPVSALPKELLAYPEGDAASASANLLAGAAATSADDLLKLSQKREATYKTLLLDATNLRTALAEEKRWNIPTPITLSARTANNEGTETHKARMAAFIRDLNGAIADAVLDGVSQPIAVPFAPGEGSATKDAFLLGINVRRVDFAGGIPPDEDFTLFFGHPKFGVINREGESKFFSDYARNVAGGGKGSAMWPIRLPNDVSGDWQDKIKFAAELANVQHAMFPLLSAYELHVEILNKDAWGKPPVIERIDIEFISIGAK